MTERYEATHPLADYCQHAGVGKACRPCRTLAERAATASLESLVQQTEQDMRSLASESAWKKVDKIREVNEYVSNYLIQRTLRRAKWTLKR